jgi:hypothetical protein
MTKRLATLALASALAAGGGVAFAQVAFADPSGCSVPNPSLTVDGTGYMTGKGTARCSGAATRYFRAEIKQAISFQTDPLVSGNTVQSNGPSYSASTSSCDHGNVKTYYARTFFTSNTTYHDSGHQTVHTC